MTSSSRSILKVSDFYKELRIKVRVLRLRGVQWDATSATLAEDAMVHDRVLRVPCFSLPEHTSPEATGAPDINRISSQSVDLKVQGKVTNAVRIIVVAKLVWYSNC